MDEIKKLLGKDNLIIGSETVLKAVKSGQLKKVYLASNAGEELTKDLDYYSKLSGFEIVNLKMTNEELGVLCKKPFSVQVLGVK